MTSSHGFNDISVEQYTERSIVVRGETRKYKEDLKKLGGKYNSRLRGEPGWIFPITKKGDVLSFISNGERLVSEEEEKAGEIMTREWENKRENDKKSISQCDDVVISMLKKLSFKIDRIETVLSNLLSTDQKNKFEEMMNKDISLKNIKLTKKIVKKTKPVKSDDITVYEDDIEVPRKRLLR